MSIIDTVSKQYFGKPTTFADAFNFLLYGGEQVINPENLTELDTTEIAIPYNDKERGHIQKYRDLLKAMTDGKVIYAILGAELQSSVHYAMPVKDALYDAENYAKQVQNKASDRSDMNKAEFLSGFRKTDKLIPVITAVIYTGSEPWDGPSSLIDMMDVEDKRLLPFINNYHLNLISAVDLPEEAFSRFHTDLGFTMKLIKHQKDDADKIIEETEHRIIDADAAFFLKEAANLDLEFEVQNGGVDMCASLEKRYKEKEQETKVLDIKNLMKNLRMTIEEAMDALSIPSDQRANYINLVNAKASR